MTEGKGGDPIPRRELLKKLIPTTHKYLNEPLFAKKGVVLSRRSALKFMAGFGLIMAINLEGIKDYEAYHNTKDPQHDQTQEEDKGRKPPERSNKQDVSEEGKLLPGFVLAVVGGPGVRAGISKVAEAISSKLRLGKGTYKETILETSLQMASAVLAQEVFAALKIKHTPDLLESDYGKHLLNNPALFFSMAAVQAPLFEETLFRLIPSEAAALIKKNPEPLGEKSELWKVGIPISAIFALGHNFQPSDEGRMKYVNSVPLAHFMMGLFFWHLMREKGFNHAVLAHSYNNTLAFAVAQFFHKTYPNDPFPPSKG